MNILLIVNASPWGTTLAATATRFLAAAPEIGHRVPAVFFHGDGVYNALGGRARDAGAVDLAECWTRLAGAHGTELLLCSAAAARRFSRPVAEVIPQPFREAGLAELLRHVMDCERVVTF